MCVEHAKQKYFSKQQLPEISAEVDSLSKGQVHEYSPRHSHGELHATVCNNNVILNTEHCNSECFLPMSLLFFYSMHEYTYSMSFERTKMKKKLKKNRTEPFQAVTFQKLVLKDVNDGETHVLNLSLLT